MFMLKVQRCFFAPFAYFAVKSFFNRKVRKGRKVQFHTVFSIALFGGSLRKIWELEVPFLTVGPC